MSRCSLIAVGSVAAMSLISPSPAVAAPCGVTAVAIEDRSPFKPHTSLIDRARDESLRRGDTKNVGQQVKLGAVATGAPAGTLTFRWFVEGELIADYTESPAESSTGDRIPLQVDDLVETDESGKRGAVLTGDEVGFFWRMQGDAGLPKAVTVTVQALEAGADVSPCATVTKSYTVERNQDDPERQPEDYYAEINHDQRVLTEHRGWHSGHALPAKGPYQHGAMFADFHTSFLANYSEWREAFGYPRAGLYVPGTTFADSERGFDVTHVKRGSARATTQRPLWSTRSGIPSGTAARTKLQLARPTGTVTCPGDGGNQRSLADFKGDLSLFGCAIEWGWHGTIHVQLGGGGGTGDMSLPSTAPKDPIFWRWHNFVDNVFDSFRASSSRLLTGVSALPASLPPAGAARARKTSCRGLKATIVGTGGDDVLRGTTRIDIIAAGRGDDRVRGLGGDDVICGGAGRDRIDGGTGDDVLDGGPGSDHVTGARGDDELSGGGGRDRLLAGRGFDQLRGGRGDDRLSGGPGSEWLLAGDQGDDRIDGGSGRDQMFGGAGRDRIDGGSGDDRLDGGAGDDTLDGGAGRDDAVYLLAPGSVSVDLGEGRATGHGKDRLADFEAVDGSQFADRLTGGDGTESLNGFDGADAIAGGGGGDVVDGGTGADSVSAGGGEDICLSEEARSACEE